MIEKFYRVQEVAELLGICTRGVWRLVASGEVQPVKVGGATRFPASSLERYQRKLRGES